MGRKKDDKKKYQVKLTLDEDDYRKFQEYQLKNKIEGSLQNVILLAAKREETSFRLIDADKLLIEKVSYIKTLAALLEWAYEIAIKDEDFSEHNLMVIQDVCTHLRDYKYPGHAVYDTLDAIDTVYCQRLKINTPINF